MPVLTFGWVWPQTLKVISSGPRGACSATPTGLLESHLTTVDHTTTRPRYNIHLSAHMSWLCFRCVPVLRISLSPLRETVWWWFMETHQRTLACGLPEPVRWKVMASSVKGNKVWYWLITTTMCSKSAEYLHHHLVWRCRLFRLRSPSSPATYSCLPVKARGVGWSDLPGRGEATGLVRCSAPLRIFEWDPGHGEESLRAGLPHAADQQPAPACLDLSLQLWSEPIILQYILLRPIEKENR